MKGVVTCLAVCGTVVCGFVFLLLFSFSIELGMVSGSDRRVGDVNVMESNPVVGAGRSLDSLSGEARAAMRALLDRQGAGCSTAVQQAWWQAASTLLPKRNPHHPYSSLTMQISTTPIGPYALPCPSCPEGRTSLHVGLHRVKFTTFRAFCETRGLSAEMIMCWPAALSHEEQQRVYVMTCF